MSQTPFEKQKIEAVIKRTKNRILTAIRHKEIDVQRPTFIIAEDIPVTVLGEVDHPQVQEIGENISWKNFIDRELQTALREQREMILDEIISIGNERKKSLTPQEGEVEKKI